MRDFIYCNLYRLYMAEPMIYAGDIAGSSKQGDLNATYAELMAAWGEPTIQYGGTNPDTRIEWRFQDDEGNYATIYDYGRWPLPLEEVVWWSIGGKSFMACEIVREVFAPERVHGRGGDPFAQSVV